MIIYVTRDHEPMGGFYSGSAALLPPTPFAEEIRRVDGFPEELWKDLMDGGKILPGPEELPEEQRTLDEFWFPWFDKGVAIWRK